MKNKKVKHVSITIIILAAFFIPAFLNGAQPECDDVSTVSEQQDKLNMSPGEIATEYLTISNEITENSSSEDIIFAYNSAVEIHCMLARIRHQKKRCKRDLFIYAIANRSILGRKKASIHEEAFSKLDTQKKLHIYKAMDALVKKSIMQFQDEICT